MAVMGAVVMGLIGFFIYLTTKLATPQMTLLYGDLSTDDSSRIVSQLQSQNIPYEMRGNGTQVYVPGDKVLKMRMGMANQGLPSGGSMGYEIFDNAGKLGATNFVQNVNLVRALEGELSRTIGSLDRVQSARVHLVLPKRELFTRQKQQPSASIILKMGGGRLGKEQVSAIQHLVAAAIPGLDPNRISIVDNKGSLLARGFDEADPMVAMANKAEEKKRSLENRLARTIEGLLEKTVGFGKARAEVTAEMDFDRINTTEEKYDPDGQVVRSTQSVEESAQANEADANQQVSVATNLPDPNLGAGGAGGASSGSNQNRTEETVNFEISKKIINHVRESGVIKHLSVAVLVDGIRSTDENGDPVYQPRGEAEMELLATLVRSAIGFSADRGDSVDVINMQYVEAEVDEGPPLELFFGLDKNDLLRIAEFLVLGIVAILVILLVVRPLVSRAFETIPTGISVTPDGRLLADTAAPALGGPAPTPRDISPVEEEQFEELIDIDRVEGRVKASSVKKVGEIVEKHPEEALSIIRSWMYQES